MHYEKVREEIFGPENEEQLHYYSPTKLKKYSIYLSFWIYRLKLLDKLS